MHDAFEVLHEVIQFCYSELAEARTANEKGDVRTVEQHFRKIYNKLDKAIAPQDPQAEDND